MISPSIVRMRWEITFVIALVALAIVLRVLIRHRKPMGWGARLRARLRR